VAIAVPQTRLRRGVGRSPAAALIVVDDKGNDFFTDPAGPLLTIGERPERPFR
jgi:hypothetical protein